MVKLWMHLGDVQWIHIDAGRMKMDETRDLLARTSQFCSGCIFPTIAASFFAVSSFGRPVRLLLNFCKRSLLVMGFLVRYLLTASSVIPWGPSSLPVGIRVLFLEPPPARPAEGAGDARVRLLAGLPPSPGVPFLLALAGRFFDFATKIQTI